MDTSATKNKKLWIAGFFAVAAILIVAVLGISSQAAGGEPPVIGDCPEGSIREPEGGCVAPVAEGEPCDLRGIGNSEGLCVPCPTSEGYVIVHNTTCVPGNPVEPGPTPSEPCESEEHDSPECEEDEPDTDTDDCPDRTQGLGDECLEDEPVDEAEYDEAELAAERFDDVSISDTRAKAIGFLLESGITTGCDEDSFCPDDNLTRQEFVTFLYRLVDSHQRVSDHSLGSEIFDDVAARSYSDVAIGWAYGAGITTGCGGGSFCPESNLNKAQVATFLYRAAERRWDNFEVSWFEDVDGNAYYAEAASWNFYHGVMKSCGGIKAGIDGGVPQVEFCPASLVNRGQAAVILYNFWPFAEPVSEDEPPL